MTLPPELENFVVFVTTLGVFAAFSFIFFAIDAVLTAFKQWKGWE